MLLGTILVKIAGSSLRASAGGKGGGPSLEFKTIKLACVKCAYTESSGMKSKTNNNSLYRYAPSRETVSTDALAAD